MTAQAQRGAVKFFLCFLILIFIGIAIAAVWPAGFFKPMLFVAAGGTCITLLWPSQAEGNALIKGDSK